MNDMPTRYYIIIGLLIYIAYTLYRHDGKLNMMIRTQASADASL